MRLTVIGVGILWSTLLIVAVSASAAPIIEQRFNDPSSPFPRLLYSDDDSSAVFAPFQLTTGSRRVEQILWWGSGPSNDFTIRFHDSIAQTDGSFLPDRVARVELAVSADSMTAGTFTELYWTDLAEPILLPTGIQYLSIVSPDFFWHTSVGNDLTLRTLQLRQIGFLKEFIYLDANAAFVLNDAIEPIPEPTTAIQLMLGLAALAVRRRTLRSSFVEIMARPVRLERTTLGSASRCSIQLSYGRAEILRVGSE